jgi:hypothetical protein
MIGVGSKLNDLNNIDEAELLYPARLLASSAEVTRIAAS